MEYSTLDLNLASAKDLEDVNLASAKDLEDVNLASANKMDVYAVVSVSGNQKTETPVDSSNPIWNFPVSCQVGKPSDELKGALNFSYKLGKKFTAPVTANSAPNTGAFLFMQRTILCFIFSRNI
ncbi:toll-interacting protein [Spatholobus suberectus]|nr:toll-interacting protein [Spatholobus suberectus]